MKLKIHTLALLSVASAGLSAAATAPTLPPAQGTATASATLPAGQTETDADGRLAVFVQLAPEATATRYAAVLAARGDTDAGRREAGRAAQAQAVTNRMAQADFAARLQALDLGHAEIYRIHRAANGLAIRVRPDQLSVLRSLPGVRSVEPIVNHELHHQTSVPFIGAPNTWTNTPALMAGAEGEGISIGIIDTGVDYQHPALGGTGVLADYQANDRTIAEASGPAQFPTARVVGGFDFAGDLYNGGATAPSPDPDPMDCNGHGSHVAGSAAGGGVNADGTPYAGPWDNTADLAALRIGPGVAPRANIYALRVFGCGGSTGLTAQAIDWATDPNNDDDLSDRLDVINMSLGSNYGSALDVSTIASDNAAAIGVIVVASAGNAGDTFFISGSPGASQRTIAVANSVDGQFGAGKVLANSPALSGAPFYAGLSAMGDPNAATPIPLPSGETANVVVMVDATGAPNDGCQAPTNAAALAGAIALADRGTCNFNVKFEFAQQAGAIGVLIADNVADVATPNLGGTATVDQLIPMLRITLAAGNTIKAALANGPVNVTLQPASAGDTLSASSSRGPRGGGGAQILKPDVAAPGTSITSIQTGITCTGTAPSTGCIVSNPTGFIANGAPLVISGTSMAAPHIAGAAALMRQQFPTRSVEEIKAMVMNGAGRAVTAGGDQLGPTYSTSRIGSGRTEVHRTSQNVVQAFNAEDAGAVSIGFDVEPTGTNFSATKSVRLVNRGASSLNLSLEIQPVANAPGMDFFLPVNGLTLPAGGTQTVDVILSANATLMDRARDPATVGVQSGFSGGFATVFAGAPRHYLNEEAAILRVMNGTEELARLPLHAAARPHSQLTAPSQIATGGAPSGSGTLTLGGAGVCTGNLAGSSCSFNGSVDQVSLVTPFELQAVSPREPTIPSYFDIRYAGVQYDPVQNLFVFGVSTWGEWKTPGNTAFNICVDQNEDGTYDRILLVGDVGQQNRLTLASATGLDVFSVTRITPPSSIIVGGVGAFTNLVNANVADTALYNTNVLFAGAAPADLGLVNPDLGFRWTVASCPGFNAWCARDTLTCGAGVDRVPGPLSYNGASRGLAFNSGAAATNLIAQNGTTIPVDWNTANLTTNGSLGALMLFSHNTDGTRDQVVLLEGAASSNLGVAAVASSPSVATGSQVVLTYTVTNQGAALATGVVADISATGGLSYVSDNGGGAFNSANGTWTIGDLAAGATASLEVTASVTASGTQGAAVQLSTASPIDAGHADNRATVTINATRSSDLRLQLASDVATVAPGGTVAFTLTLTTLGPDDALSVYVTEAFAEAGLSGLAPTGVQVSDGTYDPATGIWQLPTRARNAAPSTLRLEFTAPANLPTMTLQASASASTADANSANNSAEAAVVVLIDPLFQDGFE